MRIIVATLDYLSNITNDLRAPTLISEDYIAQMETLSMRDGITGLYNHSSCYELLELEFRTFRRYAVCVSLILLGIDDFKAVNDRCGHQEGERIFIELARMMCKQVRNSDIYCRFGGEEFVVILPFTSNPDEVIEIAERIRVQTTNIPCGGKRITISDVVAVYLGKEL